MTILLIIIIVMKGGHSFKQAQTTIEFLLGPIKIKDGLFMGDQLAAKDIEFIISNKVTHIINTVSKTVPNLYERFGIQYLSVHWTEKEENIFDKKNNAVNAIFSFVEEAMEAGESCLIHSVNGKSRACAVLVAYMMKKYNWSLSKCLEFINLKKEGLEVRNNYLAQMQELEKRIMAEAKLSNSWNEIKNEEDLILANTFYNSKRSEPKQTIPTAKKNPNRKITWNEKLVQRQNNLSATLTTKLKEEQPPQGKLRSILKGDQDEQKEDFLAQQGGLEKSQKPNDGFISTINGNIVHVTVNNFINTDKKPPTTETPVKFNTRPFSSDAKDREKKVPVQPGNSKLFPYDSGMSTTFKNPYEMKMIGKIGSNTKPAPNKKKEEVRAPISTFDRPTSASIAADKKKPSSKPTSGNNIINEKLGYDMMITGSSNSKKRYPSSNPKEDSFKWK